MTSQITKETFEEILDYDYNNYSLFLIRFFYICSKKGSVFIKKFSDDLTYSRPKFHFEWSPNVKSEYSKRCVHFRDVDNNNTFCFSTLEELESGLKKQYICPHHSVCIDSCPAGRIVSPEEKCAICLREVQLHLMEETTCGHRFCLPCLNTYVKSKLEQSEVYGCMDVKKEGIPCPTCRRNLKICIDCGYSMYACVCT